MAYPSSSEVPAWTTAYAETEHAEEGSARLRVVGVLDVLTARDLRPILDELIARRTGRLVVDLSELRHLDSTGVGVLLSTYKRLKAEGRELVVIGVCDQPLAVLRALKLDRILGFN